MQHIELPDLKSLLSEVRKLIDFVETKANSRIREIQSIAPEYTDSAVNLLHYLTLRSLDLSALQAMLQRAGLSSLGRSEGQVLANLKQVANRLSQCVTPNSPWADAGDIPVDWEGSEQRIRKNASTLFGKTPSHNRPYIMVTAPDACDDETFGPLIEAGMNCLRVNTAHGHLDQWRDTIRRARSAALDRKKDLKVFIDLPGPKIRTGPIQPGPRVVKAAPRRNALGQTIEPVALSISGESTERSLGVPEEFRQRILEGDILRLVDTRGRSRILTITKSQGGSLSALCERTLYFGSETILVHMRGEKEIAGTRIAPPQCKPQRIELLPGDRLLLTADQQLGQPTVRDAHGVQVEVPRVACTFPEVLEDIKVGEAVYFDDGKIRGIVSEQIGRDLLVKILTVQGLKGKLDGEKGINFPDSHLTCSALTEVDVALLKHVVELGDGIALSFVNSKEDVRQLRRELAQLNRPNFPVILKIETNTAFHNLAELVLEGMREYPFGVMIARGDLAVECGFERLAELQEEIMWVCEAAHVPVIWATQVLESLAKTGVPTRAEISDAALSARAECVMLNKGPFIEDAVKTLSHILEKMQGHQSKKRSVLRALTFGESSSLKDSGLSH